MEAMMSEFDLEKMLTEEVRYEGEEVSFEPLDEIIEGRESVGILHDARAKRIFSLAGRFLKLSMYSDNPEERKVLNRMVDLLGDAFWERVREVMEIPESVELDVFRGWVITKVTH